MPTKFFAFMNESYEKDTVRSVGLLFPIPSIHFVIVAVGSRYEINLPIYLLLSSFVIKKFLSEKFDLGFHFKWIRFKRNKIKIRS